MDDGAAGDDEAAADEAHGGGPGVSFEGHFCDWQAKKASIQRIGCAHAPGIP